MNFLFLGKGLAERTVSFSRTGMIWVIVAQDCEPRLLLKQIVNQQKSSDHICATSNDIVAQKYKPRSFDNNDIGS
jgi:hypothetical protein